MRRFRVSIGSILILIAICGVGFAALKHPSGWWANGLVVGDLCLCIFALMAVGYRRGARRAFWLGFALFGWVYLVLGFAPGVSEIARPHMLTTKVLLKVWPELRTFTFTVALAAAPANTPPAAPLPPVPASPTPPAASTLTVTTQPPAPAVVTWTTAVATQTSQGIQYFLTTRSPSAFDPAEAHRVGHALWALLLAIIGGGIARLLFVTRRQPRNDLEAPT